MSDPRPAGAPRKGPVAARPGLTGAPARIDGGPVNPFAPEPQAPAPDDGRGAAGRSVRRSPDQREAAPPPGGDRTTGPSGPSASVPFATYGPDSRLMAGGIEGSRSQSMGVLAIVGGLVFMAGSIVVVGVVALLLMFWWTGGRLGGDLASADPIKDKHIRDTGFADPVKREQGGRAGQGASDPGDRTIADPNAGPPPGPATVYVPASMMFLSIEVNCPGGYRGRGKFRSAGKGEMKATAPNVPGDEKCVVTFQGSEPAKTYVSGNQTLTCSFNPTECHAR